MEAAATGEDVRRLEQIAAVLRYCPHSTRHKQVLTIVAVFFEKVVEKLLNIV